MTIPTNWPNPEQPGVPMFPNITARHVLENKRRRALKLVLWDHEQDHYCTEIGYVTPQQMIGVDWEYYAPVLTPTQIAEMLEAERERCARICNDIGAQASLHISELSNRTHGALLAQPEKGRMDAAYECAGRIRNLGATP